MSYQELTQANFTDAMATAYATEVGFSSGHMVSNFASRATTIWGKVLANAAGGAVAGMTVETMIEAGLADIYSLTNGKDGEENIDLVKVLTTGAVGTVAGAALTVAPEVLSGLFRKLGLV
ncbi:MAG: hypothetical protein JNJ60_22015 [Rhodocyclaceae bacterium]|nr:hypothetical protein [Rhodocyclaceae bacterium]